MTQYQTIFIAEPGKQDITIVREFDAPREKVFRAFTEVEWLVQWLLPTDMGMALDYRDNRTGGAYRYLLPGPGGSQTGIFGVIHEISSPERMIQTFEYEGLPERGHVVLETTRFEALPGNRTRVTILRLCESEAFRDGMFQAGMEPMTTALHQRLDEALL
ncbi:MAG: ATPase [Bacteroidetes bacterium]|nr:MAG: ATPase [Bacteroidota bacterium]